MSRRFEATSQAGIERKLRRARRQLERECELTKKGERELLDEKLAPVQSFSRGVQVGALTVGAVNTMIPGQFGVVDWPLWVRMIIGVVFLIIAAEYLMRQRGLMIARGRSRATS